MNSEHRQVLLDRARRGDNAATGELLEGYRAYIRLLVLALRRDQLAARLGDSDLVQDAFVEAFRTFGTYAGDARGLGAWVRTIVVRTTLRTIRAQRDGAKRRADREVSVQQLDELVSDGRPSPSSEAIHREEDERFAEELSRLPEEMQQVVVGRLVHARPYEELAKQLGRTNQAVRALYTRALRRLRDSLGD